MNINNDRIEYIDVAKGIGILLVILGHVVSDDNYRMVDYENIYNFIYSFHMPLFLVITGLCLKESEKITKYTVLKMMRTYLIPYAIWTVFYMAVFTVLEVWTGEKLLLMYYTAHAVSICGLAPLWFLLAIFISKLVVSCFKQLISTKAGTCVILIIFAAASIFFSFWYAGAKQYMNLFLKNWLMGLFRIFPTTFFVMIGYKSKNCIKKISTLGTGIRISMIALMLVVQILLCHIYNERIDVHVYILGNQWLYFIKALNGTALILVISQMIHSKVLTYIGSRTKELMILHYPPFYYIAALSYLLERFFNPNIIGAAIITVVTTVCCLATDQLMGRIKLYRIVMGEKKIISDITDTRNI